MEKVLRVHDKNLRRHERTPPLKQQHFTLQVFDLDFDIKPDNISPGGMFFRAGVLFPVGALLEIELTFAGRSARSQARVRHRCGGGVGLAFVDPPADFRDLIQGA